MKPIWIVDDDQSIRFVLEKALLREGLSTRSFTNPREVLVALATENGSESPQVLVSDIRMPGGSGLDLLTQVKIMSTELENFASTLADRVELELEAEARLNYEQQQQRELLRRAVAQAAAVSAPASTAPVPAAEPAAPGELPGWEDAQ